VAATLSKATVSKYLPSSTLSRQVYLLLMRSFRPSKDPSVTHRARWLAESLGDSNSRY
jgi:hypothetical protein